MTQRLYYDDTYLTEFEATVLECKTDNGKSVVRLDRSAFYPTSGGQPYDTGTIGSGRVLDVYVDSEGEVWHILDIKLAPCTTVSCKIDWERRFDHMQQHAGEHMLANAAYRLLGGHTIGLHLGVDDSSIDMDLPNGITHISKEQIDALEDDVNYKIQRDVCIRQWFPDAEELSTLPLRKKPSVSEHVRVVQIGDLEFCACGGTHPSTAGQIGLMKITDARPSRGKLRITFVCGMRAYRHLRAYYDIAKKVGDELSTSVCNIPTSVCSMSNLLKETEKKLSDVTRRLLLTGASEMIANARISKSGIRVASAFVDADTASARDLATTIAENDNMAVFIGTGAGDNYAYIACRSGDINLPIGAVLAKAAKACGGKGGGRSDFAQGGGPKEMLNILAMIALDY